MNSPSVFLCWDEARVRSLESLGTKRVTTLVAGGIVNPFGPTLTALLAEGTWEQGAEVTICHLMLNPFRQTLVEVGTARIGDNWTPDVDLRPFFDLPFGDCPSLLVPPSVLIDSGCLLGAYAEFLGSFEAGFATLEAVRRFPGNPRGRVQEQIDEAAQMISTWLREDCAAPGAEPSGSRALTPDEAAELARLLLDPASLRAEMKAFSYAWLSAIEFHGDGPFADRVMPFDQMSEYFDLLAETCRFIPQEE